MKLVAPEQMKAIDTCAINEYGIPGLLLMESAASAVVKEAECMAGGCMGRRITVLAGCGNNGGDAFAAARLLHSKGADVRVYLVGSGSGIAGDALVNLGILGKIGIKIIELIEEKQIHSFYVNIEKSDLLLDGLFGTGLSREVGGLASKVIERVNASKRPVLSIDIPSGIDGATGAVRGTGIRATSTVTFCLPKTGLVLHPGCEYTGKLIVADIGIPPCIIDKQNIRSELIDSDTVANMLPERFANSSKGDYGRVMLLTGSTGMTGSGCLASMAALRAGAGLVYTAVPASLAHIYGARLTEPVILPLEDVGSGYLAVQSIPHILDHMKRMDVAAIGPGLSCKEHSKEIVEKIIKESTIPLVLDADALNAIAENPEILKELSVDAVITPHPGEMARLTELSIESVQADRVGVAKRVAMEYGVTVVLKGSRTVVAQPDGHFYVNPSGNVGMATAGTGDVLMGIIAGLLAQGATIRDSAVAGVYLHGLAGDMAADELGMYSMLASDVIMHLPQAFSKILGRRC